VRATLQETAQTAEEIATRLSADAESVWHCLNHLSANDARVKTELSGRPAQDTYWLG